MWGIQELREVWFDCWLWWVYIGLLGNAGECICLWLNLGHHAVNQNPTIWVVVKIMVPFWVP